MAVNSSGSAESDPEAPVRRRRPPVKKKTIVDSSAETSTERSESSRSESGTADTGRATSSRSSAASSPVDDAAPRTPRRKVRRAEPAVEVESDSFGFDPEEFLPPAVERAPSRPSRSRSAASSEAPAPRETTSREPASRESASRERPSRETSSPSESPRRESSRAESTGTEYQRSEGARSEGTRSEGSRPEGTRSESTRREPARRGPARRAPREGQRGESQRTEGQRETQRETQGEPVYRNEPERQSESNRYSEPNRHSEPGRYNDSESRQTDRYYGARQNEDSEGSNRTDSNRTDSNDDFAFLRRASEQAASRNVDRSSDRNLERSNDRGSDQNFDRNLDRNIDRNIDGAGPVSETGEPAESEESEFQRRRRRRRRPRTGGRPEGQSSPPQSQSQLGAARFNNSNNRNAPRSGGRPQQRNSGGGRPQGGGSRDRVGGGGSSGGGGGGYGNREGAHRDTGSREGGRTGGYRDRGPREYSPDRIAFNEQAMADIPGTAVSGVLELHPKGYGFLRDPANNYSSAKTDPFVSGTLIERSGLREGVLIKGEAIPGPKGQGPRLKSIESVEGRSIEEYQKIKTFDTLTAINPHEQIILETGAMPITMRVIDLLCPIGKGQRALIVAPPRTGKTMLLQDIANSVSKNHPEMYLIVLLIDERPEEVTEMRRNVHGEVIASSMDRDVESHVRISQLIIERGKRIAESGGEVFILLDSITRTARAFNKWVSNTGRTTTGGLDVKALDIPKKMFGTARLFDEGGSLTIAATALIETGSRMDDVIFQEFKGTGNMEMVLSRNLADRRIWPAIDIQQSGTRREEKILSPETLEGVTMLRRSLLSMNPVEGMEQLTKILQKYPTNREFLSKIRSIL